MGVVGVESVPWRGNWGPRGAGPGEGDPETTEVSRIKVTPWPGANFFQLPPPTPTTAFSCDAWAATSHLRGFKLFGASAHVCSVSPG